MGVGKQCFNPVAGIHYKETLPLVRRAIASRFDVSIPLPGFIIRKPRPLKPFLAGIPTANFDG